MSMITMIWAYLNLDYHFDKGLDDVSHMWLYHDFELMDRQDPNVSKIKIR